MKIIAFITLLCFGLSLADSPTMDDLVEHGFKFVDCVKQQRQAQRPFALALDKCHHLSIKKDMDVIERAHAILLDQKNEEISFPRERQESIDTVPNSDGMKKAETTLETRKDRIETPSARRDSNTKEKDRAKSVSVLETAPISGQRTDFQKKISPKKKPENTSPFLNVSSIINSIQRLKAAFSNDLEQLRHDDEKDDALIQSALQILKEKIDSLKRIAADGGNDDWKSAIVGGFGTTALGILYLLFRRARRYVEKRIRGEELPIVNQSTPKERAYQPRSKTSSLPSSVFSASSASTMLSSVSSSSSQPARGNDEIRNV